MHDEQLLANLGEQLDTLKAQGKTDSPEYEKLSDEYQALAQELVLNEIFDSTGDLKNV